MANSSLISSMNVALRADTRPMTRDLAVADKQLKSFQSSTQKTADKAARNRKMMMQQAGYQIQDFIIQVQGGTSAFVAFGQQGSQLASMLGPAGAVVGTLITLGSVFGSIATSAKTSATEVSNFVDTILSDFERLDARQKRLADDLLEQQANSIEYKTMEARKRRKEIQAEIKEIESVMKDGGMLPLKYATEFDTREGMIRSRKTELRNLNIELEAADLNLQEINNRRKELSETGKTYISDELDALGITNDQIEAMNEQIALEKKLYDAKSKTSAKAYEKAKKDLSALHSEADKIIGSAFGVSETDEVQDQIIRLGELYEQGIISEKAFQETSLKLWNNYYESLGKAREDNTQHAQQLAILELQTIAGGINNIERMASELEDMSSEGTAAAKALFAFTQGLAIANTIVSTEAAAIAAGEKESQLTGLAGFLASSTAVRAMGYASAGIIAGQTISGLATGQFHGGVDNIPDSMNNKSFILKKGERVVQPEANKDLTEFLASGGEGASINAPLTIQGNVTDEKWFDQKLTEHRNTIAAAYSKVKRERPRRK